MYSHALQGMPVSQPTSRDRESHVYHLYVVETAHRDALQSALSARGISTGIHYPIPVHLQEACSGLGYRRGDFPVTERAAERILSLPMFPELTEAQIQFVAQACQDALMAMRVGA